MARWSVDHRAAGWIEVEHAENARRVERAHAVLAESGALDRLEVLPTREATIDELLLVHTEEHVEHMTRVSGAVEAAAGPVDGKA